MKNFEMQKFGVAEMDATEMKSIDGGLILALLPLVGPTVAVFTIGVHGGRVLYHAIN